MTICRVVNNNQIVRAAANFPVTLCNTRHARADAPSHGLPLVENLHTPLTRRPVAPPSVSGVPERAAATAMLYPVPATCSKAEPVSLALAILPVCPPWEAIRFEMQ